MFSGLAASKPSARGGAKRAMSEIVGATAELDEAQSK
jgi:hypothetical protein